MPKSDMPEVAYGGVPGKEYCPISKCLCSIDECESCQNFLTCCDFCHEPGMSNASWGETTKDGRVACDSCSKKPEIIKLGFLKESEQPKYD